MMKKIILVMLLLSVMLFKGYGQESLGFTIQINPTLNSYKFVTDENHFRPNLGFSSALYIFGLMYVELGYSRYVSHLSRSENANSETFTDNTFSNYISHVGANIGKEICFSPYVVWGMTDILQDMYTLYFGKYKSYSGSWKGRCLTYGFGAKINVFSFKPYFFSLGFSKMYPWASLALDMFDPSLMHGGESSTLPYKAASKQLCFELGLGLFFGEIDY